MEVDEDMTPKSPPPTKISEGSSTSQVRPSEPVVTTHVTQITENFVTPISTQVLTLTQNISIFFQAQILAIKSLEYLYQDILPFFKDHALPEHVSCFKKLWKLRSSDLSKIASVTDNPTIRARELDMENYIHSMFRTEQYSFVTLMDKRFVKEVACKLIQAFE